MSSAASQTSAPATASGWRVMGLRPWGDSDMDEACHAGVAERDHPVKRATIMGDHSCTVYHDLSIEQPFGIIHARFQEELR